MNAIYLQHEKNPNISYLCNSVNQKKMKQTLVVRPSQKWHVKESISQKDNPQFYRRVISFAFGELHRKKWNGLARQAEL